MSDPGSYTCRCGWSRIILEGESVAEARAKHERSVIHSIEMMRRMRPMRPPTKHEIDEITAGHAWHDDAPREFCRECDNTRNRTG